MQIRLEASPNALCSQMCSLARVKDFHGAGENIPKPSGLKSSSQLYQAKGKPQADKRQSKTIMCH